MNIELHIERIVLDGLDVGPRDRPTLQATIESELVRLLTSGGVSSQLLSGGALRSLSAGEIQVPIRASGAELGIQIAQAVHSGIGAEGANSRSQFSSNPIGTGKVFR
jgi:hypothetical protein